MLWSDWSGMDDNWDLEAVVRGCCSAAGAEHPSSSAAGGGDGAAGTGADPLTFLANWEPLLLGEDDMDEQSFNFPDLLATETAMQELEELCKPFFHKDEAASQSPQPAISAPAAAPPQARPQRASQSQIPRSKRRKNQLKKVVCQVPAEGLSSDMWAWRKYGQKPIKGSPYPRGYYRCSSSKGCLARKQVERSCSDPSMFIITYTSEHNHPVPTHRNSLAGSTRQKYSSSATAQQQPASAEAAVSPTLSAGLSPTTPLTATSAEEEDNHQHKQEEESSNRGEEVDQEEYNQDDMFVDLGELRSPPEDSPGGVLDSWFSESSPVGFPAPWIANSNTAAAAGGR